jgi:hypothetical protein
LLLKQMVALSSWAGSKPGKRAEDKAAPDCTRDPGAFGRTAAAALGFCVLGGMPMPAAASRHAVSNKHSESSTPEPPKQPSGPLLLSISIASQRVTVYDNGTPIASSQISTGMSGHPTPMGIFSVIQKQRWHHSNLYSNAPMPYMQRITWSGVALHAGVVPGYPASHGCIRLPAGFAVRLYGMTRLGARVIITRGTMTPYVIDHPRLAGLVKPPETDPSPPSAAKPDGAKSDGGALSTGAVVVATTGTVSADDATRRDLPAESVPADSGHPDSVAATPTPAPADTGDVADSAPASPGVAGTADPATAAPAAAEPKPEPPPKGEDVLQRPGQLSLFVSRREGKLFVRKGFVPAFDVPLTIAEPDKPLGTHIFTAASDRTSESGGIRWLGVSLGYDRQSPKGKHKVRGERERPAPVTAASPRQSAIDALDRIELPPEAVARLSHLVTPGTSLVISDHGLGGETGTETDFIVVTQ